MSREHDNFYARKTKQLKIMITIVVKDESQIPEGKGW